MTSTPQQPDEDDPTTTVEVEQTETTTTTTAIPLDVEQDTTDEPDARPTSDRAGAEDTDGETADGPQQTREDDTP